MAVSPSNCVERVSAQQHDLETRRTEMVEMLELQGAVGRDGGGRIIELEDVKPTDCWVMQQEEMTEGRSLAAPRRAPRGNGFHTRCGAQPCRVLLRDGAWDGAGDVVLRR